MSDQPPISSKGIPSHSTRNKAVASIEQFRANYLASIESGNFDYELWHGVEVVSASVNTTKRTGKALFTLTMPAKYCNQIGIVMGGAIATLFDGLTGCCLAMIATDDSWQHTGLTRNLNITYLRPVLQGCKVELECEIVDVRNKTAIIRGVLRRWEDGKLLGTCVHEKYDAKPKAVL